MRRDWDETWMDVAETIALRSPCSRRQIGAVIVTWDNRVVATGYNGPPAGLGSKLIGASDCRNYCTRAMSGVIIGSDYASCVSIHAEANALLFADRRDFQGGMLYVTSVTCWDCAKLVANSGIASVIYRQDDEADAHRLPDRSIAMLNDSGIETRRLP